MKVVYLKNLRRITRRPRRLKNHSQPRRSSLSYGSSVCRTTRWKNWYLQQKLKYWLGSCPNLAIPLDRTRRPDKKEQCRRYKYPRVEYFVTAVAPYSFFIRLPRRSSYPSSNPRCLGNAASNRLANRQAYTCNVYTCPARSTAIPSVSFHLKTNFEVSFTPRRTCSDD